MFDSLRRSFQIFFWWVVLLCTLPVSQAAASTAAASTRRTVCVVSFNSTDEVEVFRSLLPADQFVFVDLSPRASTAPVLELSTPVDSSPSGQSWMLDRCHPDLQCDVVVYSAEFAGRFFGKQGFSLSLQDMEEAACQPRCAGLFHHPQEVFLLGCNTLATKDQDSRTPDGYLQVLLDHGFDRASAEEVVALRYGPLGPSFREALRRAFAGVPRIYGFSSVAPKGERIAPLLAAYLRSRGNYARYLERTAGQSGRNLDLLRAFRETDLTQASGLRRDEAGAADRDAICSLYDERRSVPDRLRIARGLMSRPDLLAFVPTLETVLARHPPDGFQGEARALFGQLQGLDAARERVLGLFRELDVSALKLELAHFALEMRWITHADLRRTAVDGARQLLARPLTSESVDILCTIAQHEDLSDEFTSRDFSKSLFDLPEGLRLVDCLHPTDERINARLTAALDSSDSALRLWAAYVLSRRLPLDDHTLVRLAAYLNDPLPDLRERVRWSFRAQRPTSAEVAIAVRVRDPGLAKELQLDTVRLSGR